MKLLITFLFLIVFDQKNLLGAQKGCTFGDVQSAALFLDNAKSWDDFFEGYKRYSKCDQGDTAEEFTDLAGNLLWKDWYQIDQVSKYFKSDPNFKVFLLHTVQGTLTLEQAVGVKKNAKENCPKNLKEFCNLLISNIGKIKGEK